MRKVTHALVVLAAIALFVGVMPVLAQEQAKEAATVAQGQLLRVDVNAKTLAIRSSDGNQMQFRYTEQTKVVGGDKSVAGLATMAGSPVTIRYTKQGADNVATEIEVQQGQQQPGQSPDRQPKQ